MYSSVAGWHRGSMHVYRMGRGKDRMQEELVTAFFAFTLFFFSPLFIALKLSPLSSDEGKKVYSMSNSILVTSRVIWSQEYELQRIDQDVPREAKVALAEEKTRWRNFVNEADHVAFKLRVPQQVFPRGATESNRVLMSVCSIHGVENLANYHNKLKTTHESTNTTPAEILELNVNM